MTIRAIPFLLFPLLSAPGCITQGQGNSNIAAQSGTEKPQPSPRVVEFKPGIRIDYRVPQVEVAGEVILREGPLELFAYCKAPISKEHETILLLDARPEHIYQALGLIGLLPGHPMSYDLETQVTTPPAGDPVDVLVRYELSHERDTGAVDSPTTSGGDKAGTLPSEDEAKPAPKLIEESACKWMLDLARKAPMKKTHWLFTGSKKLESGRFYADIEGTAITVVNFDSALLALPELHTDSDAGLWLAANTDVIPPVGTKVTLILRPASPSR